MSYDSRLNTPPKENSPPKQWSEEEKQVDQIVEEPVKHQYDENVILRSKKQKENLDKPKFPEEVKIMDKINTNQNELDQDEKPRRYEGRQNRETKRENRNKNKFGANKNPSKLFTSD